MKYPETLLGSEDIARFYRPDLECFFFDRNRQFFEHIIQFYQCGRLNIPNEFDCAVAKVELAYFRIRGMLQESEISSDSCSSDESFTALVKTDRRTFRRELYLFLNNPKHSKLSMVYNFMDVILVSLAMFIMMFETDKYLMPDTGVKGSFDFRLVLICDNLLMLFFTVDLVLRMVSWPSHERCSYFKDPMNLVDIVAVSPYYLSHVVEASGQADPDMMAVLKATRLLRMVRIFRFKFDIVLF